MDLTYEPNEGDLICEFRVEPAEGISIKKAAEAIAAESSIGTWTELTTMEPRIRKMAAKVYEIKGNHIRIAYPIDLFEPSNVPQILSSIAGNIFGMKAIRNLRLQDVHFPASLTKLFKGPEVGLNCIRRITGVRGRPLLGTIFKPKLGLTPKRMAEEARVVYTGGIDWAKDDENLTSMNFNEFEDRVTKMREVVDEIKSEQDKAVIYAPNITAPCEKMIKRAQFVKDHGGKCVMIDILTAGWSALQTFREQNFGLIVHAHRASHAAFTRYKKHGISMLVIAKVARLIGVSALHTGTVVGKLESPRKEVQEINTFLRTEWHGLKPVMPIASGGLHPGLIPRLVRILGKDLIINFGGGLWGHPAGSEAGAKAIVQALDATMQNIPLEEYGKGHRELATALKCWKN